MKKKLKTIISTIIIIYLMMGIAINAFIPEDSVKYLGYRTFIVLSPSMDPTIKVKDMIIITKAKEDSLSKGDIITFLVYIPELDSESYVTHNIADIQTTESGVIYKTQGEGIAEGEYDEWKNADGEPIDITFDDIEGKYLMKIVKVGYVTGFLQNPIYLGLVLVNIFVIVVTVKYIKSGNKNSKEEFNQSDNTKDD